jgi:transglutaminase-like putative cysteine protease
MRSLLVEKFPVLVNRVVKPQRQTGSIFRRLGGGTAFLIFILASCAVTPKAAPPGADVVDESSQSYARFVENNLAWLDRIYTRHYEPCDFIVDTESGSTAVQNLIDLKSARRIQQSLALSNLSDVGITEALVAYLRSDYRYVSEPQHWVPVAETIRRRSGDCKNLSLLLLSLLTVSGLDAYGAISNGHMWVSARVEQRWIVLETVPKESRSGVYRIPGFYSYPLYKIYPQYSTKRRKLNPPT